MPEVQVRTNFFPVSPKAAARIEREAIRAQGQEAGISYLDMEQIFLKVRGALAHLGKDASFESALHSKVQEYAGSVRKLLPHMRAADMSPARVRKIKRHTDELEFVLLRERSRIEFVEFDEVTRFILICDDLRRRYEQEHYDPVTCVTPEVYALAHLIAENFEVYERTLNAR